LGAVTTGVATDGYGNVYTAGYTDGSLGGPHQGGYYNAWLVKYSNAGAFRWKRQLGTSAGEAANGVATDGNGNVYIAGWTGGDALAAKYSPAGALRWMRRLEGAAANGIATDGNGNVYIAGWIGGDALVAKYSPAGALRWVRRLVGATANAVATDGDGNVYIAGSTGPYQGEDALVAKYSAAGTFRWRRQLQTSKADDAHGVATDGDGNVYVAGRTGCCVGVPPGADAWLAKYSAIGALRWKRQLKTSEGEAASGVATDGDGNVYVAGTTDGSLGGPNEGYNDAWLAKYYAHP
jgi:Beta-propeller repeat